MLEVHFSVLQGLAIAEPYILEHLADFRRKNQGRAEGWIMKEHRRSFATWLMDRNIIEGDSTEQKSMNLLASGPSIQATSWQAYDINGYTLYTKQKDKKSVAQNSGIRIEALDPLGQNTTYFGFIEEIWKLDYGARLQIPFFKCKRVKHPNGVTVDGYGLTTVDLNNVGHKDEP